MRAIPANERLVTLRFVIMLFLNLKIAKLFSDEVKTLSKRSWSNFFCRFLSLTMTNKLLLFENNSFDFIYSSKTLQHLKGKLQLKYLKEFARILKPQGVLAFQLPPMKPSDAARLGIVDQFKYKIYYRVLALLSSTHPKKFGTRENPEEALEKKITFMHCLKPTEAETCLTQAGLKVVHVKKQFENFT